MAPALTAGCPLQGDVRSGVDLGAWNTRVGLGLTPKPWEPGAAPTVHLGPWQGAWARATPHRALLLRQWWVPFRKLLPPDLCSCRSCWVPCVPGPGPGMDRSQLSLSGPPCHSLPRKQFNKRHKCLSCLVLRDPPWPLPLLPGAKCLLQAPARSLVTLSTCLLLPAQPGTHEGQGHN